MVIISSLSLARALLRRWATLLGDMPRNLAISFVLMRKQKIREAFAFDRHFLLAGFALWPPPAS